MKFIDLFRNYFLYSIILGLGYPLVVFGIGIISFHKEAKGSLILSQDGKIIGSKWIAQDFKEPIYFSPRPSAENFDALPSGASNLSATSKELWEEVKKREDLLIDKWEAQNLSSHKLNRESIPDELKFASSSGLEPFLSYETSLWQAEFVAEARGVAVGEILKVLEEFREKPSVGIFGRDRVNILELNLALDKKFPMVDK